MSTLSMLDANTSQFGRVRLARIRLPNPFGKTPYPGHRSPALGLSVAAPRPADRGRIWRQRPLVPGLEPEDIFEFLSGTGQTAFSTRHYFFKSCRGCRNPIQSFCRSTVRAARTAKCG